MSAGTVTGLNSEFKHDANSKNEFHSPFLLSIKQPCKKITKISRSKLLQIFLFTVQKWLTADSDKFNITVCRFHKRHD